MQEIKTQVAQLMVETENKWKSVFNDREATQEEHDEFTKYREQVDEQIQNLIPRKEKLSICLTGVAAEGVSHYDIEDSLQTTFKAGEGIQYDSEGGQFWVYVKSSLVQKVLRYIDFHFPGKINLNVSPNEYANNPWFQNWSQARRYLKELGE